MYYHDVGDTQNSFARFIFLNELLTGQESEYIDTLMLREEEPPFRFDPQNCYLCLLGVKKEVYSAHYDANTNDYMRVYVRFEQAMAGFLEECGYTAEITLLLYGGKQIVMLYSPSGTQAANAGRVAQYAQDCLQAIYRETFLSDSLYCNQTYYCPRPLQRQEIAGVLKELAALSELRFFLMEPIVLSADEIEKRRRVPSDAEIRELRHQIITAITEGNSADFDTLFDSLMLANIKQSFNFYLLQDSLALFKRVYQQACDAYNIPPRENTDQLFDHTSHPSIEALTHSLRGLFFDMIKQISARDKKFSRLVQAALRVINAGFSRPELSLDYVAEHVNVNPSYLSSVFNREVGMNLARYVMGLRVEKAKALIASGTLRVADIALQVGYHNKRYFCEVFKKIEGCTPKEYGEKIRENL